MKKIVIGDYRDALEAKRTVEKLIAKGYPKNSISMIANRNASDLLKSTGVLVERDFDYVEGASDETLWQRIKHFFGFGDDKAFEVDISRYAGSIRAGHVLLLVDEALVPANLVGAWKSIDKPQSETQYAVKRPANDNADIRLEEERMQVDKKAVETGEAVIHKRVVTQTETVEVPVKHEEVVIERVPFNGQPTNAPNFEDETITIPVMEEQVQVTKKPVVTEEIKVHKRDIEEPQSVSATLKKEKLDVEKSGKVVVEDEKLHHTTK